MRPHAGPPQRGRVQHWPGRHRTWSPLRTHSTVVALIPVRWSFPPLWYSRLSQDRSQSRRPAGGAAAARAAPRLRRRQATGSMATGRRMRRLPRLLKALPPAAARSLPLQACVRQRSTWTCGARPRGGGEAVTPRQLEVGTIRVSHPWRLFQTPRRHPGLATRARLSRVAGAALSEAARATAGACGLTHTHKVSARRRLTLSPAAAVWTWASPSSPLWPWSP